MSWNFKSLTGAPGDVCDQVADATPQVGSERAQGIVDIVSSFIHDLVDAHSDGSSADIHIAISASGHTVDAAGVAGESVTVSMSVLPAPNSPTPEAPASPTGDQTPVVVPPQPSPSSPFTVPTPVEPTIAAPAPGSAAAETSPITTGAVTPGEAPPVSNLAQDHAATMAPPDSPAADAPAESDSTPPVTGMSPSEDPSAPVPIAGAASDTPSQDQGNAAVSTPPDSTQVEVPTPQPVEMGSPTDPTPAGIPTPSDAAPGTPAADQSASGSAQADEFPFINDEPDSPRVGQHFREERTDGRDYHVYQSGERIPLDEVPFGHEPDPIT